MAQIYLSIGSNIEPELHFKRCASMLEAQFEKTSMVTVVSL